MTRTRQIRQQSLCMPQRSVRELGHDDGSRVRQVRKIGQELAAGSKYSTRDLRRVQYLQRAISTGRHGLQGHTCTTSCSSSAGITGGCALTAFLKGSSSSTVGSVKPVVVIVAVAGSATTGGIPSLLAALAPAVVSGAVSIVAGAVVLAGGSTASGAMLSAFVAADIAVSAVGGFVEIAAGAAEAEASADGFTGSERQASDRVIEASKVTSAS